MKKSIRLIVFAIITGAFLLTAAGSGDESSEPLYKDKYAIEATFGSLIKSN